MNEFFIDLLILLNLKLLLTAIPIIIVTAVFGLNQYLILTLLGIVH